VHICAPSTQALSHFVPDKPSKAERRRSLALAAQEQLAQRRSQVHVI